MKQFRQPNPCENMNHRRPNAPVPFCPQCGSVVNQHLPAQACSEVKHAASRRQQTAYCVDCGTKIIDTSLR
jgi:ribosomal protein L37AE/L43A